jgi:hypothetical protein
MLRRKTRKLGTHASYFWMLRLAERLARREQFLRMHAPETILEAEEQLVIDGMGRLTVGETLFVMRYREEIACDFDPPEKGQRTDPARAS